MSTNQQEGKSQGSTVNLVDHGFMDTRAKLIDIAAFLDRLDRHGQADDYRVAALLAGVAELTAPGGGGDRARRVLEVFSDPTDRPIEAATVQGAAGAYDPGALGTEGDGTP